MNEISEKMDCTWKLQRARENGRKSERETYSAVIYDTHTQYPVRSMFVPIRIESGTKFIVRVMR